MRILLFFMAISITLVFASENLADAIKGGKFEFNAKAFYFSGNRDNRQDREALSVGGIFKYSTARLNGLSASAAFFSSRDFLKKGRGSVVRINNGSSTIDSSNIAGNSELVRADGDSIDALAESYLQYSYNNTKFKVGRQRLSSPLVNDYYNRFLPNSFEAFVIINRDLPKTTLSAAKIQKWKYKASDKFVRIGDGLGLDGDLYMLSAVNRGLRNVKAQLHYYYLEDAFSAAYFQLNNRDIVTLESGLRVCGAMQYLKEDDVGDKLISSLGGNLDGEIDSYLLGIKLGLRYEKLKVTAMLDKVGDDTIVGSGTNYSTLGWSKFINFTDIQIDGEALNAGAESYGLAVSYALKNGVEPTIKFVHIEQDSTKQLASYTPNKRPSSDEWNLDVRYGFSKVSKLRFRLAQIDYKKENLVTNEYDEVNIRIIYEYKFLL